MNAQHTPGPWHVSQSDDPSCGLLVKPIPGQIVAECDPVAEMAANARLIAAAPDMLDALRHGAIALAHASERSKLYEKAYGIVDAAIAKATT